MDGIYYSVMVLFLLVLEGRHRTVHYICILLNEVTLYFVMCYEPSVKCNGPQCKCLCILLLNHLIAQPKSWTVDQLLKAHRWLHNRPKGYCSDSQIVYHLQCLYLKVL